jgi:hypothetical protein
MAVDATSLDKSSTPMNDVSGKTIDILDDHILLQKYVYNMLVFKYLTALATIQKAMLLLLTLSPTELQIGFMVFYYWEF